MNRWTLGIAIGLVILALAAAAFAGNRRIYVCEQGYDPPCRLVGTADEGQTDWAELLAARRAYLSGVETPVVRDKYGAIAQCGPHHGQSACCRIIAEIDGKRYIECGQ